MLAATGVLRGLQDTRTPLVVAVGGNAAQRRAQRACSSTAPVRRRLGIAGSAWGSVLAQVAQRRRAGSSSSCAAPGAHGASLRPDLAGVRAAARAGVALVVRTLTLRAALLVTTYAVALGAGGAARRGRRPTSSR